MELMKLYKKEKVNPVSGCLPMLMQMPVFISLYWMIMESVELRHSPFFLWIQDLSVKDPIFILPLIMGASMWFQQRLNPAPPDPMQAKVMQMMPIMFTAMFLFFPAGLVLYWVVNNLLSIAQQWVITKQIENALAQLTLGFAPKPRHAHFCDFVSKDGDTLDKGIALFFPNPHSFTGEDVFELQGHGGPGRKAHPPSNVCGIRHRLP